MNTIIPLYYTNIFTTILMMLELLKLNQEGRMNLMFCNKVIAPQVERKKIKYSNVEKSHKSARVSPML